jgi:hypothetical protein
MQEPSPDDVTRITQLLLSADPGNHLSDQERKQAVDELLAIHHTQAEEWRQGKRDTVSPLLRQQLAIWALRIFADPDPLAAMTRFLGLKGRRGKRAVNADRDHDIAVAVAEKMSDGMSYDKAIAAVANELNLSAERIETIYKDNRLAAKAQLAMRKIEASEPPAGEAWEPVDVPSADFNWDYTIKFQELSSEPDLTAAEGALLPQI